MADTSFPDKDLMIDLSTEEQLPGGKMSQHDASSILTE